MKTIIILIASAIAWADPNVIDASKRVQEEMKDPAKRQGLINSDSARQEMQKMQTLTGGDPQAQQEIMEISADLIPVLMEMSGNDPAKVMDNLAKFKSNPEEFVKHIPVPQQDKIRKLAEKLAKNQKKP